MCADVADSVQESVCEVQVCAALHRQRFVKFRGMLKQRPDEGRAEGSGEPAEGGKGYGKQGPALRLS